MSKRKTNKKAPKRMFRSDRKPAPPAGPVPVSQSRSDYLPVFNDDGSPVLLEGSPVFVDKRDAEPGAKSMSIHDFVALADHAKRRSVRCVKRSPSNASG